LDGALCCDCCGEVGVISKGIPHFLFHLSLDGDVNMSSTILVGTFALEPFSILHPVPDHVAGVLIFRPEIAKPKIMFLVVFSVVGLVDSWYVKFLIW